MKPRKLACFRSSRSLRAKSRFMLSRDVHPAGPSSVGCFSARGTATAALKRASVLNTRVFGDQAVTLCIPILLLYLSHLLRATHKRLNAARVEMLALLRFKIGERLFDGPRMLVRPLADQGVKNVGNGNHARHHWNVLAMQSIRVA